MNRFAIFFYKVATLQPKPYIGYDGHGEPLSRWFYKPLNNCNGSVFRNSLGNFWYDFFSGISDFFNAHNL